MVTNSYNIGNVLIATFTLGAVAVSAHALRKSGLFGSNNPTQEKKEVKAEAKAGVSSPEQSLASGSTEQPSSQSDEKAPTEGNKLSPSS